jgi:hypothetical protein
MRACWLLSLALALSCKQDSATTAKDGGAAIAGASAQALPDATAGSSGSHAANAGSSGSAQDAAVQPGDAASTTSDAGARSFSTDRARFGLGGASRCANAGVLLCDDFESNRIDPAIWTLDTWGSGSATIDSSLAARGSHSLHITEPSGVSHVVLRETKTFATTGNHFFGRFFMYLDYTADALSCPGGKCTNLVHWTAASAGGAYVENSMTFHPDVRAVGAVNQNLLVNLDGGPKAEVGVSDDASAPAGYTTLGSSHVKQWMCFEFEYAGVGDSAEVRVWWDGQEHPALHYSTSHRGDKGELWPIPKYDHLDFGFTHYQDYSSVVSKFDAWLDEIAVDDQRIGCAL